MKMFKNIYKMSSERESHTYTHFSALTILKILDGSVDLQPFYLPWLYTTVNTQQKIQILGPYLH